MEQIRMCLNCGCNLEYEDDYCERCNYRPPTNKITLILERANGVNVVVEKTRLKKQLSPFRYPGGKSKLIDYLYTHINQNKKKLISPFSGGASFELSLLESGVVDTLHINDMDYFVFAFWKQVKDNHKKLCENILEFEVNHNNVQAAKDIITSGVEVGIEEAATMAIVANRMSYLTYDEDPIFDRYGLYNGACVDIVSRKYSIQRERWNVNDKMKLVEEIASTESGRDAIEQYIKQRYGAGVIEENRNKVKAVLAAVKNGECTQYRVASSAGLSINVLKRYLEDVSSVDNMRLGVAEKIARFYDQELEGGE